MRIIIMQMKNIYWHYHGWKKSSKFIWQNIHSIEKDSITESKIEKEEATLKTKDQLISLMRSIEDWSVLQNTNNSL